jgi:hypothetical protein
VVTPKDRCKQEDVEDRKVGNIKKVYAEYCHQLKVSYIIHY